MRIIATNINNLWDKIRIKGYPKILSKHEMYTIADALYFYQSHCEKLGGGFDSIGETAGSLALYFDLLPSKVIIIKDLFK